MIKLLTFDLDNTLWSVEPIITRAETAMMDWIYDHYPELRFKISLVQFEQYKEKMHQEYPQIRHDLTQLRLHTLKNILADHVRQDQISFIVQKAYEVFFHHRNQVQYFPYVLETLEELSSRYPLYALSNGNADIQRVGLGHIFGEHLSAASVGHAKPHPAMYLEALRRAKVQPYEAIHIGDHPVQDIQAAHDLGMKTIWINWLNYPWPLDFQPDATVTSFEELLEAIAQLDVSEYLPCISG